MKRKLTILLMSVLLACLVSCGSANDAKIKLMPLVEEQMALGPRTPGSDAHARFISRTVDSLSADGWTVRCEAEKYQGKTGIYQLKINQDQYHRNADKGQDNGDDVKRDSQFHFLIPQ